MTSRMTHSRMTHSRITRSRMTHSRMALIMMFSRITLDQMACSRAIFR